MAPAPRIAFFVSPHGFGHAARATAVMAALRRRRPDVGLEIFTTIPEWFFADSLRGPFGWHRLATDVGMVQRSAVEEDAAATCEALLRFRGAAERSAAGIGSRLAALGVSMVAADVSPLGLLAARHAGLPSALIESFTWDWIYAGYLDLEPRLAEPAEWMAAVFAGADLRIRCQPVCGEAAADLSVPPVARRPRLSRVEVRRRLGIGEEEPAALVTMGGLAWRFSALDHLTAAPLRYLVFAGGERVEIEGTLVRLPERPPVTVPELIGAVDAVVGKLGYSTVAEAYQAGVRYGWVGRRRFPESPVLARFVGESLPALEIARRDLETGAWPERLPELLSLPRPAVERENGDEGVAGALLASLAAA